MFFFLFFRLEVLENIFSLIFLRSENLREDATSDSGAEDDDNHKQIQHHISMSKRFNNTSATLDKQGTKVLAQSLPPIAHDKNDLIDTCDHSIPSSLPVPLPKVISTTAILSSEYNRKYKKKKVLFVYLLFLFVCFS